MKLTLDDFQKHILPGLRAANKGRAALQKAIDAFLTDNEITDEKGAPVSVSTICLEPEPEPEPTTKAADKADKDKTDDLKEVARKAVEEALAAGKPKRNKIAAASTDRTPARPRRYGPLSAFKGESGGASADERAYRFGMWAAACCGHNWARGYCASHDVLLTQDNEPDVAKSQWETINSQGGYLVPEEFSTDLIDVRDRYGVFRGACGVTPMTRDTLLIPRWSGGLVAYFVGEGTAPTKSTATMDQVRLTARKLGALAVMSSELSEDAIINVGDKLADDIGRAFADKEDDCGFNGDGTSTYGNITGVRTALTNLSGTIANIAGLVVATGTTYLTPTLSEVTQVQGRLQPQFYQAGRVGWYCSQIVWGSLLQRLAQATGGATPTDIVNGIPRPMFNGYPVIIAQKMPQAAAASQVCLLFGNLSMAAKFGARRETSIRFSTEGSVTIGGTLTSMLETDQVAVVGFERFDINVHDVGNAHATAASRVAGPIVGLILAAS